MSLRDAILAADDRPLVPEFVPEWNVTVYFRPFSLADLLVLEPCATDEEKITLKVLEIGLCDAAGAAVFDADGVKQLKAKSGPVLQRLAKRALKVGHAVEGEVDRAEKN